jgi:hypothetical protein
MRSFQKGDRVSHSRFGPGVVIAADVRYTIIAFDEAGVRKFVTALVQLERSNLPVPVKPAPERRRRPTRGQSIADGHAPPSGSFRQK